MSVCSCLVGLFFVVLSFTPYSVHVLLTANFMSFVSVALHVVPVVTQCSQSTAIFLSLSYLF